MPESITYEDARVMHEVLRAAAGGATVRHYRYTLNAQADEWGQALVDFASMDGEGAIELAGTLMPGMFVVGRGADDLPCWRRLVRATRGGDLSFEVDSDSPQRIYRSFASRTSPVVVRR